MSKKYLYLRFENARLYDNYKTKDFVAEYNINDKNRKAGESIRTERASKESFVEPITVYQISNLIHVLLGERPVPTFRGVCYSIIEEYFNKAKESYIKIDEIIKNSFGNEYQEMTQLNKSADNSWSKLSFYHWEKIKRYLGDELFITFKNTIDEILGFDSTSIPFDDLKLYIDVFKKNLSKLEFLKTYQKTPIYNFLTILENDGSINKFYSDSKIVRTVNKSPGRYKKLSGYIYIPVNEKDLERLKTISTGTAKLLDGGFVYLKDILDEDDISKDCMDEFIKVSDISDKKKSNESKINNN